ncbi:hypothetical protein SEEE1831_04651, partial [Salmonella enterica subsp. enterica serovar Enteritidis str. 13183-1]
GHEKVAQLERKIGTPLRLYSGYSDSKQDNPLLYFCQHRQLGKGDQRFDAGVPRLAGHRLNSGIALQRGVISRPLD